MPRHRTPSSSQERLGRTRLPAGASPPDRSEFTSPTRSLEYQAMLTRLREARVRLGLSQAEVARRIGRTNQFVSKIETGERRLDPIDLWQLAGVYGRPPSAFLPPQAFTQSDRDI